MLFHDTPTEYEWQAVQAYFHDSVPAYMALLRLDDPVTGEDFYQLPNGMTLDVDDDRIGERILAVGHADACDREGCDVYLLEGELSDLRIDRKLHLPLKLFGSTAIVFFGNDFVFLGNSRGDDIMLSGKVGGELLWNVLEQTYGEMDFDRLDPEEMAFASVDLNGDRRKEVLFLNPPTSMLCYRTGCNRLLTPDPEDTSVPFPEAWRAISPPETDWGWDAALYVTPQMVRGWRVLRYGRGCYVWYGNRYAWFAHATFRLIPVQGCFE